MNFSNNLENCLRPVIIFRNCFYVYVFRLCYFAMLCSVILIDQLSFLQMTTEYYYYIVVDY